MKNLLLSLILLLFIPCVAYSDVFVYYDKDTQEVEFIFEEGQRIRLSDEDTDRLLLKALPGRILDYGLTERYEDYRMISGRFILNTNKISDRVNQQEAEGAKATQKLLNQDSAKIKFLSDNSLSAKIIADQATAKAKLIILGLTPDEADSLIVNYNGLKITEDEFNSLIN